MIHVLYMYNYTLPPSLPLALSPKPQGTHSSLRSSRNAKATVAAIINGVGSMGAALGPPLIGWITDEWVNYNSLPTAPLPLFLSLFFFPL